MAFLWICIILLVAVGIFAIFKMAQKKRQERLKKIKEQQEKEKVKESVPEKPEPNSSVVLRPQLVTSKTVAFLNTLEEALPQNFVAIPLVAVEKVFTIESGVTDAVKDKYFDIVVYSKKEYKPLFVIDLYDPSMESAGFKPMDPNITKILQQFGILTLKYPISSEYTALDIKLKILQLFGVSDMQNIIK